MQTGGENGGSYIPVPDWLAKGAKGMWGVSDYLIGQVMNKVLMTGKRPTRDNHHIHQSRNPATTITKP